MQHQEGQQLIETKHDLDEHRIVEEGTAEEQEGIGQVDIGQVDIGQVGMGQMGIDQEGIVRGDIGPVVGNFGQDTYFKDAGSSWLVLK